MVIKRRGPILRRAGIQDSVAQRRAKYEAKKKAAAEGSRLREELVEKYGEEKIYSVERELKSEMPSLAFYPKVLANMVSMRLRELESKKP